MKAYREWGKQKITIDSIEPTHYVRNFLIFSAIKKLSKLRKVKDICEIGCGVGILSDKLGKAGFKVDAFDLDKNAVNLANRYNKGKNVKFSHENILTKKINKKYDLVLAVEVLEHIKNDSKAVKNVSGLLNPNGFFLITVPINEGYRTEFDNRSGHIRRYSKKDLTAKLEKENFRIIKTKYFNFPLLWLWYFYFYLPYSNKKSKSSAKKLPFYAHFLRIVNKIFLIDLLFSSSKATNIMVLAQKPSFS